MSGAEGATAPETLRPKDRTVGDALESSRQHDRLTDGVTAGLIPREISQVTGQRGRGNG